MIWEVTVAVLFTRWRFSEHTICFLVISMQVFYFFILLASTVWNDLPAEVFSFTREIFHKLLELKFNSYHKYYLLKCYVTYYVNCIIKSSVDKDSKIVTILKRDLSCWLLTFILLFTYVQLAGSSPIKTAVNCGARWPAATQCSTWLRSSWRISAAIFFPSINWAIVLGCNLFKENTYYFQC